MRGRRRPWVFRCILPLMFAQLGFVLLIPYVGISLLLAGVHGHPPALLGYTLRALTMPWGLWGFGAGGFFVNLCILAGLGYLLDRVIEPPRRPR